MDVPVNGQADAGHVLVQHPVLHVGRVVRHVVDVRVDGRTDRQRVDRLDGDSPDRSAHRTRRGVEQLLGLAQVLDLHLVDS